MALHEGVAELVGETSTLIRSLSALAAQTPAARSAHLQRKGTMADTDLDSSNPLCEILADWNEQLKQIDFESLDDPQAQPPVVEFEEPQP